MTVLRKSIQTILNGNLCPGLSTCVFLKGFQLQAWVKLTMSLLMTPNGPAILDGSELIPLSDALDAWYLFKKISSNMHVIAVTEEHTTFEITCTRGLHEALELHGTATECDECDGTLEDSFEDEDDGRSFPLTLDNLTPSTRSPILPRLYEPSAEGLGIQYVPFIAAPLDPVRALSLNEGSPSPSALRGAA